MASLCAIAQLIIIGVQVLQSEAEFSRQTVTDNIFNFFSSRRSFDQSVVGSEEVNLMETVSMVW